VPACGFAVAHAGGWWVYTGDTGPNPLLWPQLAALTVSDLVIEAAFSDDEAELAALALHHCPRTLRAELQQFQQPGARIWLTHLKPADRDAVLGDLTLAAIEPGQCFALA
jgi:ribonuclease BN (tRNA processing enzyme)